MSVSRPFHRQKFDMSPPPLLDDIGRSQPAIHEWPSEPPQLVARELPDGAKPPPVRVFEAETIEERIAVVDERSLPFWFVDQIGLGLDWMFGMVSLVVGLAAISTLPIVQFLVLGYMLEASGRIARTGKLSRGFVGVRKASRLGSLVFGTWLMLLPLRLLHETWSASWLIDPDSPSTAGLRVALVLLTPLMMLHIATAWSCGGRLRHFFWPVVAPLFLWFWGMRKVLASRLLRPIIQLIVGGVSPRLLADVCRTRPLTSWFPPAILWAAFKRRRMYGEARDAVWEFVASLRLPYYFWLGARGFAGAAAWLFLPILLIFAATKFPNQQGGLAFLCYALGSTSLTWVILYLPFLQTHFAAEGRFIAMFEVGQVRRAFHRAPIAFWFSLFITLLFALPLFLFKIELTAREIVGVLSFFFIVLMLPARLLTGWAVARGRKRVEPRFFPVHIYARLAQLPVVGAYVFLVFFTQYFTWYGSPQLFEQHPFLLPAPFFQW
jgi:hypothetical protein